MCGGVGSGEIKGVSGLIDKGRFSSRPDLSMCVSPTPDSCGPSHTSCPVRERPLHDLPLFQVLEEGVRHGSELEVLPFRLHLLENLLEPLLAADDRWRVYMRAMRDADGELLGYFERYEPPRGG